MDVLINFAKMINMVGYSNFFTLIFKQKLVDGITLMKYEAKTSTQTDFPHIGARC